MLGGGLLVLAIVLWSVRDTVPAWMASRMAATVELATTNERDDARVTRAFDAAMRSQAADATLEALPNQTKVRHMRLTVRAPSSNEAIEQASRMAVMMAASFKNEGDGALSVDIRRRTTAVADRTTAIVGTAMNVGAAVAGVLGILLLAAGWRRFQSGPDHLPQPFWWLAGGGLALALAPLFLPGDVIMALFAMAIPVLIAGIILWKAMQLRQAARWPSTRARIIKSKLRAQHHRHSADVTQVANAADIEYEFSLGGRVYRGTRVGLGEIAGAGLEATLNHYHVGATVPVYYDPKNPGNALLEREPPLPLAWLYAIAAAVLIAGLAIVAVFWNISAVLDGLEGYFPEKAFLPGMAFFTLGGLHDAGHAVGVAAPGDRGVGLAADQRPHRRQHRRELSPARRRRPHGHAGDVLPAGGRILLPRRRPRLSQHAIELRRQGRGLAGDSPKRRPRSTRWGAKSWSTTIRRTRRMPCSISRSPTACPCW